jgi:hypothetical protein
VAAVDEYLALQFGRYENRVNFNLGYVVDFAYINMTKR